MISPVQQQIITASQSAGIDPAYALALASSESGFNTAAVGDNGCSYGLFQLNACAGNPAGLSISDQINAGVSQLATALQQAGGNVVQAFAIYKGGLGGANSAQAQSEAQSAAGLIPQFEALVGGVVTGIGSMTLGQQNISGFGASTPLLSGGTIGAPSGNSIFEAPLSVTNATGVPEGSTNPTGIANWNPLAWLQCVFQNGGNTGPCQSLDQAAGLTAQGTGVGGTGSTAVTPSTGTPAVGGIGLNWPTVSQATIITGIIIVVGLILVAVAAGSVAKESGATDAVAAAA